MDLDPVEHRYLLAGAADASLAAYDTRQPSRPAAPGQGGAGQEHRALFTITKQTPGAHAFSVSSVAWYPVGWRYTCTCTCMRLEPGIAPGAPGVQVWYTCTVHLRVALYHLVGRRARTPALHLLHACSTPPSMHTSRRGPSHPKP